MRVYRLIRAPHRRADPARSGEHARRADREIRRATEPRLKAVARFGEDFCLETIGHRGAATTN